VATTKDQQDKKEEKVAEVGEAASPAGAQPSDQLDGGIPQTAEQAAATEAFSPAESKLSGADPSLHDAFVELEAAWAAIPLVRSEKRPDLAQFDDIAERIDNLSNALSKNRSALKSGVDARGAQS
jgi:hypothetical protein